MNSHCDKCKCELAPNEGVLFTPPSQPNAVQQHLCTSCFEGMGDEKQAA